MKATKNIPMTMGTASTSPMIYRSWKPFCFSKLYARGNRPGALCCVFAVECRAAHAEDPLSRLSDTSSESRRSSPSKGSIDVIHARQTRYARLAPLTTHLCTRPQTFPTSVSGSLYTGRGLTSLRRAHCRHRASTCNRFQRVRIRCFTAHRPPPLCVCVSGTHTHRAIACRTNSPRAALGTHRRGCGRLSWFNAGGTVCVLPPCPGKLLKLLNRSLARVYPRPAVPEQEDGGYALDPESIRYAPLLRDVNFGDIYISRFKSSR